MGVRIGFDHYTIAERGWSARQTMEFARDHQFDGVQFLEPAQIDQGLDAGKLTEFRRWVEAMGLYLEVGLPPPSPVPRGASWGERSMRPSAPESCCRTSRRSPAWAAATAAFTWATVTTGFAPTPAGAIRSRPRST